MERKKTADQTPNNDKKQALDTAIRQIEKNFGKGAVMRLGDRPDLQVDAIPTGSLALDAALGIGGVPKGRISEIYGPGSSGKTTLARHIVARRKETRVCIYRAFGQCSQVRSADKLIGRLVEADMSVLPHTEKLNSYTARSLDLGIIFAAKCIGIGCRSVRNICIRLVDINAVKKMPVHKITVAMIVIGRYGIVFVKVV